MEDRKSFNEENNDFLGDEINFENLEFEFIEDKDLECVSGGVKVGAIYIDN
jgi:hypothetical protein